MIELKEIEEKKRPELLRVLCILTFIGSGLSLVSNSIMFMVIGTVRDYYEQGKFDYLILDMDTNVLEILLSVNASFFLFQGALFALTIYGAYLMWNLKKLGFHIYTIAQISILILSQIYMPELPFPTFELIISLIFVTLYAKNINSFS